MEWPWNCERRCTHVPTDQSRNLIVLAGDRIIAASCDHAINYNSKSAIWKAQIKDPVLRHHKQSNSILMASCTEIHLDDDHFQVCAFLKILEFDRKKCFIVLQNIFNFILFFTVGQKI